MALNNDKSLLVIWVIKKSYNKREKQVINVSKIYPDIAQSMVTHPTRQLPFINGPKPPPKLHIKIDRYNRPFKIS